MTMKRCVNRVIRAGVAAAIAALALASARPSMATPYTWGNAAGNWSAPGSWTPSGPPLAADTAVFSGAGQTVTLGAESIANFTVSGTGAWTWQTGSLNLSGLMTYGSSGNSTFSAALNGVGSLTISSGTLTVSGDGTNSGGTVLNPGATLSINNSSTGGGGAIPPTSGPLGIGTLTINGGELYLGTASRTLANALVLNGNFTRRHPVNQNGWTLTLSGNAVLSTNVAVTFEGNNSTPSTTFSGIISDGNSGYGLSFSNNSTYTPPVTLNGNNAFGGGVTAGGVVIWAGHNNALGTGTLTLQNNATIRATQDGQIFPNVVRLDGDAQIGGANPAAGRNFSLSGGLVLSGNRTVSVGTYGNKSLSNSSVSDTGSGPYTLSLRSAWDNWDRSTLTFSGSSAIIAAAIKVNDGITVVISGDGNTFNQSVSVNTGPNGAGVLSISGANNIFNGGLIVNAGTLQLANAAPIAAGTITMNGGTIQSDGGTTRTNGAPVRLAGSCNLGGGQGSLVFTNATTLVGLPPVNCNPSAGNTVTFLGAVTGGGGLAKMGSGTLVLSGAGKDYQGPTLVHEGTLQVAADSQLGTAGPVTVTAGKLVLSASGNLGAGQQVTVGSTPAALGVLSLKYDGLPAIATNSSGVVAIDMTGAYTTAIDLSMLGSMYLGSTSTGTVAAAGLSPGAGGVYPLGGGGGMLVLDAPGAGVLTGACGVVVGKNGGGINYGGTVILADSNSFSGPITINRGSTLTGYAQASGQGSPFGSASGVVTNNGGTIGLDYGGAGSARQPVAKGAMTVNGGCGVSLNGSASAPVQLTFDSLVRGPGGSLEMSGLSANARLLVASSPPTPTNGMVSPWYVIPGSWSPPDYVTYGANGFVSAAGSYSNYTVSFTPAGNEIASINGGSITVNNGTVYALRINDQTFTVAPGRLGITSGAIYGFTSGGRSINGGSSATVDVGTAECLICYNNGGPSLGVMLAGQNGLTKTGAGTMDLGSAPAGQPISGKITVSKGALSFYGGGTFNLGTIFPNITELIFNGGGMSFGGGSTPNVTIPASLPVTIGPNGGQFPFSAGTLNVASALQGDGLLTISGGGTVNLSSPSNTHSGGMYVSGATVTVGAGSSAGSGGVHMSGGTLNFNGSPAQTYRLASLWGSGSVILGPATGSGANTLIVGEDGTSTYLSGSIADQNTGSGRVGALIKAGAGTFRIYGAGTYTGNTTVSNGALIVNGSLTSPVAATNAGSAFGGSATVSRPVTIGSGCVFTPGDSGVGTMATGDLMLSAGSTSLFDIGTTNLSDRVTVNGNLSLAGTFRITAAPGFGSGLYPIMTYTGTLTDNGTTVIAPPGYKARLEPDAAARIVWLNVIKRTGFVVFIK